MDSIIVDDDDDCVMVENPKSPEKAKKYSANFEKNLIIQVRKHRLLYDNKHKLFSNVVKKEIIWQKIAKKLEVDVNDCKNAWTELRYSYQCHARRLRKYFLNGHKENRKRAAMHLEAELMFLWRFIENRKSCSLPYEIEEPSPPEIEEKDEVEHIETVQFGTEDLAQQIIDDDLILVEQPVECIVIEEDDDNGKSNKQFKITSGMRALTEQVKLYPELYDSEHLAFQDYTRKSFLWNAIAGKIGDKATKLMKCWTIMQTRYEWEINQTPPIGESPPPPSDLQNLLKFFKNYILNNPDTVYKQSYYLKYAWQEPIDYFKDIYSLIARMKKLPDIVYVTDSLLKTPDKNEQYLSLWLEIASLKGCSAGQCEITWLIMRHFYWELMHMRQKNYLLTDKWFFESVITELYEITKTSQLAKEKSAETQQQQQKSKEKSTTSANRQNELNATIPTPRPTSPKISEMPTQIPPTIINNLPPQTMVTMQHLLQGPLPKITGAMSLAPQALTGAPLQIKPVAVQQKGPMQTHVLNGGIPASSAAAAANTNMQMPLNLPHQTNVSTVTIPKVSAVRSLAPTTIVHATPSTIRNLAPTSTVRSLAPATVRNLTPPSLNIVRKSAVRAPIAISNVSNKNVSVDLTTSNDLSSPQMPLTTVVSMTAGTKSVPTNTTAAINSTYTNNNTLAKAAENTATAAAATTNTPPPLMEITNTTTSADSTPLPKISGAVSLLNANEILIELIASQNGNHLVVHGPPLSEKYQLSMPTVAKFIRSVLAIPLLHNKRHNQPSLINSYWEHISENFNLPPHICRACWNFLVENFNHFPQIAPLKDLMAPFRTTLSVWKESFLLFKVFDEHCVAMGWLEHISRLPEVVESIGGYPVLYQDVAKESSGHSPSDMEALCAWRTLRLRFPKITAIQDIWMAIKNCFCQYMSELEFGVDNKWPINWWRALARLKFLVEARYTTVEPFYYIVSNKMVEEIERCAMLEMKARYNKTEVPSPIILPKMEDMELQIPIVEIQVLSSTPSSLKSIPSAVPADIPPVRKDVETVALLTAIQKHPAIYGKADFVVKYEAWQRVAKELNMEVSDCLLAFKHATQNYRAYKKQDSLSRCRLNQKYYKKLDDIYRGKSSAKTGRCLLNIKTPFELNQGIDSEESSTNSASNFVFPERYISDISMSNSPSNLVVKNWNYALGNLQLDESFNSKFRNILNKYISNNK